jgi:RimJ/RimL family protein N-acetyltransferase
MNNGHLSVRELQQSDIEAICDYWLQSDPSFLEAMGVDLEKIPRREDWRSMLNEQLSQSLRDKKSYCIIWLLDGNAVGHSNINKIVFGEEAYMHLHIWKPAARKKGYGMRFIGMTLPFFFERFELKRLYSVPYALNPAPNRALSSCGFKLVKSFITTPGWLNFEQQVNLWELTYENYISLK